MGKVVLFGFLGTNDYVPVRYSFGDVWTPECERFAQSALVQCLRAARDVAFEGAVVAMTPAAQAKHGGAILAKLKALEVPAEPLPIANGASEEELWKTFGQIGTAFRPGDHVVFDLTHGFRSLPAAGLLAMSFFRHVLELEVDVYYGAFEVLGEVREVKEKEAAWFEANAAPFFDLTPMFVLPAWAEAVAEWRRTGRATGLVAQAKPHTDALRRTLKGDAPQALTALPKDLQLLGDALTLVRQDKVGPLATTVVARVADAAAEVRTQPRLAPLGFVLDQVRASVSPLCGPGEAWREYPDAYLRHQLEVARWMAARSRLVEGFSFLRELVTSCAVRMVQMAGVERIGEKSPPTKEFRGSADGLCAKLCGAVPGNDFPNDAERKVAPDVRSWLDTRRSLGDAFREAYAATQQHRNKLDHCWIGEEHARQGFNDASAPRVATELERAIDSVSHLLDILAGGEPRLFVNLSNHPVAAWSKRQREAAQALGLGDPVELEGGMPLVPPVADADEIRRLARDIADRAVKEGACGAFVAGEFSLTYALVSTLQARGVRCFTATTERESVETVGEDGSVQQVSRFLFVRWREYPAD
jgi:hypothetical protein